MSSIICMIWSRTHIVIISTDITIATWFTISVGLMTMWHLLWSTPNKHVFLHLENNICTLGRLWGTSVQMLLLGFQNNGPSEQCHDISVKKKIISFGCPTAFCTKSSHTFIECSKSVPQQDFVVGASFICQTCCYLVRLWQAMVCK